MDDAAANRAERRPSWGLTGNGRVILALLLLGCVLPFIFAVPRLWWINAALLAALIHGLCELRWLDPRLTGAWLLPRAPHVGERVGIGSRLLSTRHRRPALLLAYDDERRRYRPTAGIPPAPNGHITRCVWHTDLPRRGRHPLPPLLVRSEGRLGLCYRERPVTKKASLIVLPAVGRLRRRFRHRLDRFLEDGTSTLRDGEEEIIRLRPYQYGDAPRLVQWKASAHARQLLVGVRGLPTTRHLALLIDTRSPQGSSRLERLLAIAATIIDHCMERRWAVSVHGPFANGGGISGNRQHLMQTLALVAAADPTDPQPEPPPGPCLSLGLRCDDSLRRAPQVLALDLAEAEELVILARAKTARGRRP